MIVFILIPIFGFLVYTYQWFEYYTREKVTQRTVENISLVNDQVNKVFDSMVELSSFIVNNNSIIVAFGNEKADYFARLQIVDNILANVSHIFPFSDRLRITLFDNEKRIYTNWSLNFKDYSYIYEKDWVQKAIGMNGHLVWGPFSTLFEKDDKEKDKRYISLARAIVNPARFGLERRLGIIVMSLGEAELQNLFSKYISRHDGFVLVSNEMNEIIMSVNKSNSSCSTQNKDLLQDMTGSSVDSALKWLEGRKYLVNSFIINIPWSIEGGEWRVTVFICYNNIMHNLNQFIRRMLLLFVLFMLILLCITGFLSGQIVKPIRKLVKGMKRFNVENEIPTLDVGRKDEIGNLNKAFYIMAENIHDLFGKLKNEHNVREKYRFESLRAQLNPHFLFNTMNMIRWMALIRKADNIVESIDALGNLLKFSMSKGDELVPLKEELESISSYVFIQNSRFGGRYKVEVEMSEEILGLRIIKFLLQPIVENAIIHAFPESEGTGTIWIRGCADGDSLMLTVEDNGVGMHEEQVSSLLIEGNGFKRDEKKVTGLGIRNVSDRIKVAYGEKYGLEIHSTPGKGTVISYTLPVLSEEGQNA
jgi:two-component system sensor histidine kinase YesM